MDFQVQQSPTTVEFIAKLESNNQLQIRNDIVDSIVISFEGNNLKPDDPVVIISAVGPPSTRKTGILNAVIRQLMSYPPTVVGQADPVTFAEPKLYHENQYKFDSVLVCPPIHIQCNDGRRFGILVLDLWNNSSMSEDVYIKLVEFCFQASSLRIYSLCSPLRPIPWGQGRSALEASNLAELRQPCWKDVTVEWPQTVANGVTQQQLPAPAGFNVDEEHKSCQISHTIAISAAPGKTGLFQISVMTADGNETGVNLTQNCFKFIIQQVFSPEHHCRRLSDLKTHFLNCGSKDLEPFEVIGLDDLNPAPPNTLADPSKLGGSNENGTGDSSTSAIQDQADIEMMEVEDAPEGQAATEDIQALITSLKPQIDKCLDSYFDSMKEPFVKGLSRGLGVCEGNQPTLQDIQTRFDYAAGDISKNLAHTLPRSKLPQDIKRFTSELAKRVQSEISRRQEELQKEMKPVTNTLSQHSKNLTLETSSCMHPGNDKLHTPGRVQLPTVHTASHLEHQVGPRTLAETPIIDAAQEDFAKKSARIAIDSVKELLLKYLESHGVLTDVDICVTFNYYLELAKIAFNSVPGFDINIAVWKAAWKSQKSSINDCLSQIRRSNSNAIRRWDRALDSAMQKATQFYNQQMDRCLPDHKVSREQLDRVHDDCVKKTLEQFSASSEIQKATIEHWKQILVKCKVEEWKEGYCIENETKRDVLRLAPVAVRTPTPSMKPTPDVQSPELPGCAVGIYFGPDAIIFRARIPESTASIQFEMKPYIAFLVDKIVYAEAARGAPETFNVFDILTKFTAAPSRTSFHLVHINGQSVSVAPEATAVLFLREALDRITNEIGGTVESCAVAVPGLLPRGALTAIKAAIKLAGFPSDVTLVPTTTALAMTVTRSATDEAQGTAKNAKKLLTIYHAGPLLEVAYIHLSQGRLEPQDLAGSLTVLTRQGVDPSHLAEKIIKSVSFKDPYAIVSMIGNLYHTGVKDAVTSVVARLGSTKGFLRGHKVTSPSEKIPSAIADLMAEFCTSTLISSASVTRSQGNKCPGFTYVRPYKVKFAGLGVGSTIKSYEDGTYDYIHKAGAKGFQISEEFRESQLIHDFDLGREAGSGIACKIIFLEDGSFHIGPPEHGPGAIVHSNSSKLLTTWHQQTVKQNVDHITQVMSSRKEPETSPPVEMMRTETVTKPNVVEWRDRLRQVLRSVEGALKISGSDEDPIYEHVSKTVTACQQLLQNPNSTVEDLESAVEKLKLQEDLLV